MRGSPFKILLIVTAVLSPFIFFSAKRTYWQTDSVPLMALQEVIYPIEHSWHALLTSIQGNFKTYINLSKTAEENQYLRKKLELLQARIVDYQDQVRENQRLRKLLGFAKHYQKKLVLAEVVGLNHLSPFQAIRITKGKADGVRIGMAVVAADGIVGRVIRTGQSFSDVQLLVDSDFKLDVLLQRSRVRGVLSGASRGLLTLKLHKRAEIRIGDTVITSGIIGGFPKGLPIGSVVKITYEAENVAQAIIIDPWVDFRRLEEVIVLFTRDEDLEKIIETAGREWLYRTVGEIQGG